MILWRISNHRSLDGTGGLRASGRWHTRGRRIVYCCDHPATALLEVLAHFNSSIEDVPVRYTLLKIDAPADISTSRIEPTVLRGSWRHRTAVTRKLGDEWIGKGDAALLTVPCALVPETWNVLVNPLHPEHETIKIVAIYEQPFDTRLVPR
jgi:RES domain-containing protein